jgi:hypothetical protein
MPNQLTLTPRQAAALDRLLDAYIATKDTTDPGIGDLRVLHDKVQGLDQDHAAYGVFTVTESRPDHG